MVTEQQLQKLQKYAQGLDINITVVFNERNGVEIGYGDSHWITMANKPTSYLTLKRVKAQIDRCAANNKTE